MKAEKCVHCPLVLRPTLFRGEHCVAGYYLDHWLITLIRHLFASDFINQTLSTFPFLTQTLNNGRPHWVWTYSYRSMLHFNPSCSLGIVCECAGEGEQGGDREKENNLMHSSSLIPPNYVEECVSRCSKHTDTFAHVAAPSGWRLSACAAKHSGAVSPR